MYYVYALLDPRHDNIEFYIGKGSKDRWKRHLTETIHTTENIQKWNKINAIRKEGLEPGVKFIEKNMPEKDAYDLEKTWIKKLGRNGYDKNGILTNICVDRRPPNRTGVKRPKFAEKMKGKNNPMWGRTGKNNPLFGVPRTDETKQKISEKNSGEKNGMYGKIGDKHPLYGKHPENNHRKKSVKIDDVIYSSVIESAKILKLGEETVRRRLKSVNFPNYIYIIKC